MKEIIWQASTGEASSGVYGKGKGKKRRKRWGEGLEYIKNLINSDQFSGSIRSAKEQNSQKPTQMLFRFLAQRPQHQKTSSQRGKIEQKSSDFWTKFQKKKRWIAAADNRYLIYLRLGLCKKGSSEVASSFYPFCSFDLLHHRQIFVQTPESEGSESKNPPEFCSKHLIGEAVVLPLQIVLQYCHSKGSELIDPLVIFHLRDRKQPNLAAGVCGY